MCGDTHPAGIASQSTLTAKTIPQPSSQVIYPSIIVIEEVYCVIEQDLVSCLQYVIMSTNLTDSSGKCKWIVTLQQTMADAQTTYTITATSHQHGSINISDVLFGDVWVCSGQSNMQFAVPQVLSSYTVIYFSLNEITASMLRINNHTAFLYVLVGL